MILKIGQMLYIQRDNGKSEPVMFLGIREETQQ